MEACTHGSVDIEIEHCKTYRWDTVYGSISLLSEFLYATVENHQPFLINSYHSSLWKMLNRMPRFVPSSGNNTHSPSLHNMSPMSFGNRFYSELCLFACYATHLCVFPVCSHSSCSPPTLASADGILVCG